MLAEIERLEGVERRLAAALGEVDHEARRMKDALERIGGRSGELERRLATLRKDRKLTSKDQAKAAREIEELGRRLAHIEERSKAVAEE